MTQDPSARRAAVDRAKREWKEAKKAGGPPPVADWLDRHGGDPGVRADLLEWQIGLAEFRLSGDPRPPLDEVVAEFPPADRDLVRTWLKGAASVPAHPPAPPEDTAFDRPFHFRLTDVIGQGGMGVVYREFDPRRGCPVALKTVRQDVPPGAYAGRFQQFRHELAVTARLQHPNVLPVYAAGLLPDGRPYYLMRLVAGTTLDRRLVNRAADAEAELIGAFAQVCRAVGHAHTNRIVHRDLKPANVMVGAHGEVAVIDWGVALDLAAGDTAQTGIAGDPHYMSPEQARGEPADARADVFALGGILCHLLTGRTPHPAWSPDAVPETVRRGDTAEANQRLDRCGAAPELVALARACLAADPTARPADANAVADKLAEAVKAITDRARRKVMDDAQTAARQKRRPLLAGLVALVALLFAVGSGWWWFGRQKADEAHRLVEQGVEKAEGVLRAARPPYTAAGTALDQVEPLLDAAGSDDLKGRAKTAREDLELLIDLDAADDRLFAPAEQGWGLVPREQVAEEYAKAFRRYGLDQTNPTGSADRVAHSAIRPRLVASLDLWLHVGRSTDVLHLLEAIDPDPFRTDFRRAVQAGNKDQLAQLAQSPTAAEQPVWFVVLFGQIPSIPAHVRREKLIAAARSAPDHFPVLLMLGGMGPLGQRAAEQVRWCQAALAVRPGHPEALLCLGVALAGDGQHAAAAECYRKVLESNPQHAFAHNNLGNALLTLKEPEAALKHFAEASRLAPEYAYPHNGAGNVWLQKNDDAQAETSFLTAVRLNPDYATPHHRLGWLYQMRKDWDRAERCYRKAIELLPSASNAHLGLGHLLIDRPGRGTTDLAEAVACYRKATALSPGSAEAHYAVGNALHLSGDLDAAEVSLLRALGLNPGLAAAHSVLGNVAARRGRWADAARHYREAVRLDARLVHGHNGLGNALVELKDIPGAITSYRRAIELDPKYSHPHNGLGNALVRKPNRTDRDLADAIASYRRGIELDPTDPKPRTGLGNVLAEKGEWAAAADSYATATCLDPEFEFAHVGSGNALVHTGDPDGAEAAYREALRLNSKQHRAHNGLGMVCERRKDWAEAVVWYRVALALEPNYTAAKQGLERALGERAKGEKR